MYKKKGIIFKAILILMFVMFIGINASAQEIQQVNLKAPFTEISNSQENRTVYYGGTGYSGSLDYRDIWVNTFAEPDGGGDWLDSFPIFPDSGDNVCEFDSGASAITGQFEIPVSKLQDGGPDAGSVEVWIWGMGADGVIFNTDYDEPNIGVKFIPSNNSKIYNYFTGVANSTNEDIYIWLKTDDTVIAKSAVFGNPASVRLDVAGSDLNLGSADADPNSYDLEFEYRDVAGNTESSNKSNIKVYEFLDPNTDRNAKTAIDADDKYQIYVPRDWSQGVLDGVNPNRCIISVNDLQQVLDNASSSIDRAAEDPNNWDVITIGATEAGNLGITLENWTRTDNLTVGVNNVGGAASACEFYFGADEGVGPRLIKSQVIGTITELTFSEPLLENTDTQADLDPNDIEVNDANCPFDISFNADSAKLIIDGALDDGDLVNVSSKNDAVMDLKGNLAKTIPAIPAPVTTCTARNVVKVAAVGIDTAAPSTTIEVTFDYKMKGSLQDPNFYAVTAVPGFEGLDTDPNDGIVDKDHLDPNPDFDGNMVVTLTIDGLIADTGDNLPQVTVLGDQIKGFTEGDLITRTAATDDEVGPYLASASYNQNPDNVQFHDPNEVGSHILTLTFSEPIDPLGADFTDAFTGVDFGTSPDLAQGGKVLAITMDDDGVPVIEGTDGIAVDDETMITDAAENDASSKVAETIADGTTPWITAALTVDGLNINGRIDLLVTVWNEDIALPFDDANVVAANSIIEGGYSIDPDTPFIQTDTDTLGIILVEKDAPDTDATPGFTLALDPNNKIGDGALIPNEIATDVVIAEVEDNAAPFPINVSFRQASGSNEYFFQINYSEPIDPNVYSDANASTDFNLSDDSQGVPPLGTNPVTKYTINCGQETLTFIIQSAVALPDPVYVFTLNDQVYDPAGNPALVAGEWPGTLEMMASVEFTSGPGPYQADEFNQPQLPSMYSMDLWGKVIIDPNGGTVNVDGWKVYAYSVNNLYDIDGNQADLAPNDGCYGSTKVQYGVDNPLAGEYYMHVYGNDEGVSPGFGANEAIYLVVRDPNDRDFLVTNGCSCDTGYYCTYVGDEFMQHDIDLTKYEAKELDQGWNLISFSTLKRYVGPDGIAGQALQDANGVDLDESVCPQMAMGTVNDVLTSLTGQWARMMFQDGSQSGPDALRISYPTDVPGSNDYAIQHFSIGYGYWIYIPEVANAELVTLGEVVTDTGARYQLPLDNPGWNLVGNWGGLIMYTDLPADPKFSTAATVEAPIWYIEDAFWSLDSGLLSVRAYYSGIKTWFSDKPTITDITYVGPGYGYYMEIDQPGILKWHPQTP